MGIKGIYGEIGQGQRVAFQKLSIDHYEQEDRPLRVAIDVSIWSFQVQAGQGGTNPAIRTLYYRLLRLMKNSVQPLFVFDGPMKPPEKRGKRTGGVQIPDYMTVRLLDLFGFAHHKAPGEAEAECALLQRNGVVDAVLSEDVDTLMFGCGTLYRNWSAETAKGKEPTHVNVYDSKATKMGTSGLDREGMILVAMISGGDYSPDGIPGCGVKVACEMARAGYGKSLCQLSRADDIGLAAWRAALLHEMHTNESKLFKTKHVAFVMPEDFPDRKILSYYTHPVVSSAKKVASVKEKMDNWDGEINIPELRTFVADAFEWRNRIGAIKFIRGLAPVLLAQKLLKNSNRRASGYEDLVLTAIEEMQLVRSIASTRTHVSNDALPEMRVVYNPLDIVGLSLDDEDEDEAVDWGRDGLAPLNEDDQIEAYASDEALFTQSASPSKRKPSAYDPSQPDKVWIPAYVVKVGVPLKAEDYEESLRNPAKFLKQKAATKRAAAKRIAGGMPQGALDKFVSVSKTAEATTKETLNAPMINHSSQPSPRALQQLPSTRSFSRSTRGGSAIATFTKNTATAAAPRVLRKTRAKGTAAVSPLRANPWSTLSASTKNSNIQCTKTTVARSPTPPAMLFKSYIDLSSSPPVPSPTPRRRDAVAVAELSLDLSRSDSSHKKRSRSSGSDIDLESSFTSTGELSPKLPPTNRQLDFASPVPKPKQQPARTFKRSQSHYQTRTQKNLGNKEVQESIDLCSSSPVRFSASQFAPSSLVASFAEERVRGAEKAPNLFAAMMSSEKLGSGKGSISKIKEKRFIKLRESLPGTWKEVDKSELIPGKSFAWCMDEVEFCDLT